MKKILLTSLIVGSALFASEYNVNVLTKNGGKSVKESIVKAIQSEKNKINNGNIAIRRNLSRKEIIVAVKNAAQSLFDLKRQDKIAAESRIKYAIKILNQMKQKIVPIDLRLFILEFKGNIKRAKEMISVAEKMMKEKNYQGAGDVLTLLKDEMDVMEIDIDKDKLKSKLQEILKKIKNNQLEKAFKDLALTFRNPNIFIKAVGKYPLGVIKAAYLIQQAHILNNSNTKEYQKIKNLIKEAKAELKLDSILGYFYIKPLQKQYKEIINILDNIEKTATIHKPNGNYNKAEKLINKIKKNSTTTSKNPRYQVIGINR